MIYCLILILDSPWYMYKGSCFKEVCADEGAVGGNLSGPTRVYIYIIGCVYIQFISILYHFSGSSEKGTFGESCTFSTVQV